MNSRRATFLVAAGAGMIAAGAVYVWRRFVRRARIHASAKHDEPATVSGFQDMNAKEVNNIIKALVSIKGPEQLQIIGKQRHAHHRGHHHGPKRSAFVGHVASGPRRGELGLPACLAPARERGARAAASASCRQQQASALKMGLARNRMGNAKKVAKAKAHMH